MSAKRNHISYFMMQTGNSVYAYYLSVQHRLFKQPVLIDKLSENSIQPVFLFYGYTGMSVQIEQTPAKIIYIRSVFHGNIISVIERRLSASPDQYEQVGVG